MRTDSTSTPDSDSWTRSGRCARPAASNNPGCPGTRLLGGCRSPHRVGWSPRRDGVSSHMHPTARAVLLGLVLLPAGAFAQTGPSDPQVIAGASTAKINVGSRKL